MSRGSELLRYNVYQDSARTRVWGDNSESTVTLVDRYVLTSSQIQRSYPVYARILPRQNVRTGTYLDSLVVTLHF
jgi:spore coat protein U-like protein